MTVNKFRAFALSAILSVVFATATFQNQAVSMKRAELRTAETLSPGEKLTLAVKGYKRQGAGVLVGMFNPILGAAIAIAPTDESQEDLTKISRLLADGADVNYRDQFSWTALMYAAYEGFPQIAQFLIDNGADKTLSPTIRNLQDWRGYTPYKIADYYVKEYTNRMQDCELKMVGYYQDLINRYAQLTEILK